MSVIVFAMHLFGSAPWLAPALLLALLASAVAGVRRDAQQNAEKTSRRPQAENLWLKAQRETARGRAADATEPKRPRGRPRKQPAAAKEDAATTPAAALPPALKRPETVLLPRSITGNNAFVGQVVAFTGTLPSMTRREAIRAVEANGGKAFEDMPASTTLLVVGDKPGMDNLNKADRWIAQVRKITPAQFDFMLKMPLSLTPDEFAALVTK